MVDVEKHRKLKENPVINWNIGKRKAKIKQQEKNLNSFINLAKSNRNDLRNIEKL